MSEAPLHEVFLELSSGSRVLVASELADVGAANAVARHWRQLFRPDGTHRDRLCRAIERQL